MALSFLGIRVMRKTSDAKLIQLLVFKLQKQVKFRSTAAIQSVRPLQENVGHQIWHSSRVNTTREPS